MRRVEPARLAARAWAESLEVRRLLSTADLSAAVSGGPSAGPGQSVTYTVRATNSGPDAAQNVVLTDVLPDGMGFVSVSQIKGPAFATNSPGTGNSGPVALSMATLPANTSAVFTLTARVQPTVANGTTLTDSTSVTSDSTDPNDANNSASTNTLVRAQGDVGVTLSAPSSAPAGSTVQYTATVQDFSTSPLDNVVVTLTLPPGTVAGEGAWVSGPVFTFVPPTAPGGPFTATIASLPAGTPAVMTFTAQTDSSAAAGTTLSATASVSGDFLDVNPGNNSASVTTALSSQAALSVSSPPAPSFVPLNDVTFGVDATNSGPSDAQNVVVTLAPPPAGVNIVSITQDSGPAATITIPPGGGPITASIPTLPAGATAHFSIATHATDSLANSSFTVPVTIASSTPAAPGGVAHASLQYSLVTQAPAVTIQSTPQAVAGTVVPFEVEITPPGTRPYPDANLRLTLPAGTSLASVFWEYGSKPGALPPAGATGTIDVPLHLSGDSFSGFALRLNVDPSMADGSALTVTGQITPSASDLTPIGAPAVFTANVVAQSDLAAAIDGPATITAGTNGTYTLTVTNNGPSDAKNVVLSDVLPAGMSFVSLTQTSGPAATLTTPASGAAGTVTTTIATLPANGSATFMLVGAEAASLPNGAAATQTVSASSDSQDLTPANNTATLTSSVLASADLAVSVVGPPPTGSGTDQSFTVTIQNKGPSDAQGVSLVNTLTTAASFLSATQTSGPAFVLTTPAVGQQGSVTGSIPVLHSGETATFTLVYRFDREAPTFNLKSTASSLTQDASAANNTGDATGLLTDLTVDLPEPMGWLAGTRNFFSLDVTSLFGNAPGSTVLYTIPQGATVTDARVNNSSVTGWIYTPGPDGTGGTLILPAGSTLITESLLPSIPEGTQLVHTATLQIPIIDVDPSNNTATLTTTVFDQSDVSLAMAGPPTIVPGTNASYTFTVTNNGPSDAHGVNLSDLLPAGMTFVSLTQTSGARFVLTTPAVGGAGTIVGSVDTLPAGASASFTLVAAASPGLADGSTVNNTANVTLASREANPADNTATVSSTVQAQADLAVSVVGPPPTASGEDQSFTVTIQNKGPSDAQSVSLVNTMTTAASFLSATQTGGPAFVLTTPAAGQQGSVFGTISVLHSGESATFTLVYRFDRRAPSFNLKSTASSPTGDPTSLNNTASATGLLTDMAVEISEPLGWVAGTRNYITVDITSEFGSAPGGTVLYTIPQGVKVLNSTGWTPGPDGTGGTLILGAGSVQILETLAASVPEGTQLVHTATLQVPIIDVDPSNNTSTLTTTVFDQSDVSLAMSGPPTIVPGTNASYSFTLTNKGPSDAHGVNLSDLLPAGMTFVSLTQTSGARFVLTTPAVGGTGTITANAATLPAEASATFTLVTAVAPSLADGSTINNTANVTLASREGNPSDNTATVTSTVNAQADLSVSVRSDPLVAGGYANFYFTITNSGPSDAASVYLSNNWPTDILAGVQPPTGGPLPPPGLLNLGSLPAGASRQVQIYTYVSPFVPANTAMTLTATTYSGQTDPNPANNTFTLTQPSQAISRLSLNVSQTPASEGQQLTYTFSFHNEGPSAIDAKNVNFAFELPEGVQFVSASGSNLMTPAAGGGGIVTAMVPELGYNQFATVTVTVLAPDELNTVSLAFVSSDTVPSDPPLIVPTLVSDPPLSILSFGVSAIEGQSTAGAVVGTFTDTGVPEDPSDYSATIVWGDGTPSSQGTITYDPALHVFSIHGDHIYSHEGTYPAILTLNHGTAGGSGADGVAIVADAPLKPFSVGVSGVEGQPLANVAVAQFGDPGGAEALSHYSAMINWGDGVSSSGTITFDSASGHFTVTGSHTYADDGSFPLAVTVNHDTAAPATFSGTAAIADAPITAFANNIRSVEGSAYSGTIASFQDGNPSAPAGDFTADINWGDGTTSAGTVVADGGGKFHVTGNHTYAIDGHFSTQVIVTDEGGSTAKAGANADVADAPLHAFSKTVSAYHKEFSGVVGQFSDDNTLNRNAAVYSAIINWGDGDLSVGTISYDASTGRWNVSGSHRWTKHGTYNLTIVVLDKGGQGTVIHSTALVPNGGNDGDGLPGNNK